MNFMHFRKFCTPNGGHDIFLIETANACKERILQQIIINAFKMCERGGLKHSQNEDGGQIVIAFTITELNYFLVSLFCDFLLCFSHLYLWYLVLCLVFGIATK